MGGGLTVEATGGDAVTGGFTGGAVAACTGLADDTGGAVVEGVGEGMEEAVVMMVGFEWSRIKQALIILENQARGKVRLMTQVIDYSAPVVSEKIARIILSYTDFVNRVVWKKY